MLKSMKHRYVAQPPTSLSPAAVDCHFLRWHDAAVAAIWRRRRAIDDAEEIAISILIIFRRSIADMIVVFPRRKVQRLLLVDGDAGDALAKWVIASSRRLASLAVRMLGENHCPRLRHHVAAYFSSSDGRHA